MNSPQKTTWLVAAASLVVGGCILLAAWWMRPRLQPLPITEADRRMTIQIPAYQDLAAAEIDRGGERWSKWKSQSGEIILEYAYQDPRASGPRCFFLRGEAADSRQAGELMRQWARELPDRLGLPGKALDEPLYQVGDASELRIFGAPGETSGFVLAARNGATVIALGAAELQFLGPGEIVNFLNQHPLPW